MLSFLVYSPGPEQAHMTCSNSTSDLLILQSPFLASTAIHFSALAPHVRPSLLPSDTYFGTYLGTLSDAPRGVKSSE